MSQSEITLPCFLKHPHTTEKGSEHYQKHGTLLIMDYEKFYRQHFHRLFSVALRILKNHELSEEAVQEAFKNIFQNVRRFRGESKLETWMTRIVVNVCLGYLRKHKNRLKAEVDHEQVGQMIESMFPDSRRNPYETTCRLEIKDLIHKGISRLKEIHREVIFLHDFKEKT